jgi:hypothetical protein
MKRLDEQRKIRHAIAHDGMNNTLRNFEHIRGTTLNATIHDRTANFISTQMFNELIDFCSKVIDAIYSVNDTGSSLPDNLVQGVET